MNILADTNLYIASMHRAGLKRKVLWRILETNNTLVITDFIIEELRANFEELYTPKQSKVALDLLLQYLATGQLDVKSAKEYETCLAEAQSLVPQKDAPVLAAAMLEDVDLLVTWDAKHFLKNKKLMKSHWGKKIKHPDELLALLNYLAAPSAE